MEPIRVHALSLAPFSRFSRMEKWDGRPKTFGEVTYLINRVASVYSIPFSVCIAKCCCQRDAELFLPYSRYSLFARPPYNVIRLLMDERHGC